MSAPAWLVPPGSGERAVLEGYLRRQRELVGWKLDGMTDEAARSVATSTGLTIHGLVRHLENVERWWFRDVMTGEQGLAYDWTDDDPDGELHVPESVALSDLLASYRAETARCDAAVAGLDLDAVSVRRERTLRWVYLHLVEETARHLGHLDLLAELADGRLGEEPEVARP